MKKIITLIGLFCLMISSMINAEDNSIKFDPQMLHVAEDTEFSIKILYSLESKNLAAYTLAIDYDPGMITLDTSKGFGFSGFDPGTDGFLAAVSEASPGNLMITGFDVGGKGPGSNLHLLTSYWITESITGTTNIDLTISNLQDSQYNHIDLRDNPEPLRLMIIMNVEYGDVNNDGVVNIVDSLMIAQYYVGLSPPGFNSAVADVNLDGQANIIDALLIAQYAVGLLPSLPMPW